MRYMLYSLPNERGRHMSVVEIARAELGYQETGNNANRR